MKSDLAIDPSHAPQPATATGAESLPLRKKTILLADDCLSIRASLGKLLHRAGYEVLMAGNGEETFRILLRDEVDLLMLDLDMPQMDGWEALESITEFRPALPVIIITGQTGERHWARAEGAQALMEKPLDLPLLLQTLRDLTTQDPVEPPSERRNSPPVFRYVPPKKSDFRFSDPLRGGKTI